MAKTSRTQRQQAARERAEERLAEARRARVRRRNLVALTSVGVVVAVVAALIVVKLGSSDSASSASGSLPTGAARAQILTQVTSVPVGTLDSVGKGSSSGPPAKVKDGAPVSQDGKPEVLYIGAEWCPFCAAERWAMVVALDRFGTFSNLGLARSSGSDTFPNTATLSFHGSTYTSDVVAFRAVETETTDRKKLDTPTSEEEKLLTTYDAPPYVDASSAGSIPFVYFGGKYIVNGSNYSPQVLAGKSWSQIASALANPSDPIAQNIDGAANTLTAAICRLTGNKPADVCASKAIFALSAQL